MIHSIDSLELAHALNERLERENQSLRALVQVNSAYEKTKSGFTPEEFTDQYARISEEWSKSPLTRNHEYRCACR